MMDRERNFDERYRRVLQRHRQLSHGYVTKLGKNGVINHHPIGQFRNAVSLKFLLAPVLLMFFLKACVLAVLGEEAHAAQIALMQDGSMGQQIGALLMQKDPISWPLAQMIGMIVG